MKLRADSFAARLTAAQRDELFAALAGGEALRAAAQRVQQWTGRRPSTQALSAWQVGEGRRRRHLAAREAMLVSMANCPPDMDAQTRRALGHAKYLAALEALAPREVAALLKADLDERRLELDRQKLAQDTRAARLLLRLDKDRLLFERLKGGEKGADLQEQIALALAEIEHLKHGEDAA